MLNPFLCLLEIFSSTSAASAAYAAYAAAASSTSSVSVAANIDADTAAAADYDSKA